jgi:hypothetical protein
MKVVGETYRTSNADRNGRALPLRFLYRSGMDQQDQPPNSVDRPHSGGSADSSGHAKAISSWRRRSAGKTTLALQIVCLATGAEIAQYDAARLRLRQHVLGLDVAMHETGGVHGGERAAQLDSNGGHLASAETVLVASQLRFERLPFDELHPDAGAAGDPLRPIDGDHVRVADAGHEPPFVDDERLGWRLRPRTRLVRTSGVRSSLSATSRSSAGIPRAVDGAESAAANLAEDAQSTPGRRNASSASL